MFLNVYKNLDKSMIKWRKASIFIFKLQKYENHEIKLTIIHKNIYLNVMNLLKILRGTA